MTDTTYGKIQFLSIEKVDKTGVFNALDQQVKRRVKNEKGGEEVVIPLFRSWSVVTRNGILEFYQRNESLYAPIFNASVSICF